MKILFHSYEYPPLGGGVGSYMRNMALALVRNGHQAMVLCGRCEGKPEESVEGGVTVLRRYDRSKLGSEQAGRILLDVARASHVDMIEGADHLGECAWLLQQKKRPVVVTKAHAGQVIHALSRAQIHYPWQRLTVAMAHARAWRQMRRERQVLERCDGLISPTQRLMDELVRQNFSLPIPRAIVPNPLVVNDSVPSVESDRPTLLYVGRIEFLKGIAFLPAILSAVRRVLPDTILEIVGEDTYARGLGSVRAWLERRFATNLSHVSFLGYLHDEELDNAYHRAWVVVHPSLWDNFPTVLLEAMVRSKAVVTTPHGGMPEMLAGTSCPVVDPTSSEFSAAVAGLLSNQAERLAAGKSARKKAFSMYHPDVIAKKYIEFVSTVVR